jgi:hypothetical protein
VVVLSVAFRKPVGAFDLEKGEDLSLIKSVTGYVKQVGGMMVMVMMMMVMVMVMVMQMMMMMIMWW